ncbi:MAG: oligoribonuclease [Gammaproteobacteria bacterium]|nr:oligoribonuclease [Gammaproteobacteria bacterium]HJL96082.1 oligoribonuclease [SAR86 cluster bacterium]
MSETTKYPTLIWLDLEMTGLDPDSERIIEIATAVTNHDLSEIIEGPNLVIKQPEEFINNMDEWNTKQHNKSGLVESLKVTNINTEEAQKQTLEFLTVHTQKGQSPLCGNTISHDRRFLRRYMPELEAFFHYRNVDVSSVKELLKRWSPELLEGYKKQGGHRAMADVLDSIQELKYYKDKFFI